MIRGFSLTSVFILSALLIGCAGPSSPFGGINTLKPRSNELAEKYDTPIFTGDLSKQLIYESVTTPQAKDLFSTIENSQVRKDLCSIEHFASPRKPASLAVSKPKNIDQPNQKIRLLPERQVLHRTSDFIVELEGHNNLSLDSKLKIYYNGVDSTQNFLKKASVEYDKDALGKSVIRLTFNRLRLPYDRSNQIDVVYEKEGNKHIARFLPPNCNLLDKSEIISTDRYKVPEEYLTAIYKSAEYDQVNPSMIAGIIAQESAFNPKAVSWAKAIGLTQVTPLAEEEVINQLAYFPQYPGLNKMPVSEIKRLIASGEVNKKNEWRLHPRLSIAGGTKYLKYVGDYWQKPENFDVINQLDGDINTNLSHVVLASYNSGPSRVKRAINKHKEDWILDDQLKEAHKYVNRVSSFCFHFSAPKGVVSL